MSVSEWESAGWSERQMVVSLKKLPATCSTNQSATQLIYRSALALFLISLSVRLPPDGPGAEGRPPSHPRPPTHSKEEARLLQRLPAEVQLAGEQVFLWRGAKVQKSQQRFTRKKHRTRSVLGQNRLWRKRENTKYGRLFQEEIPENLSDGRMLNCVLIFLLPWGWVLLTVWFPGVFFPQYLVWVTHPDSSAQCCLSCALFILSRCASHCLVSPWECPWPLLGLASVACSPCLCGDFGFKQNSELLLKLGPTSTKWVAFFCCLKKLQVFTDLTAVTKCTHHIIRIDVSGHEASFSLWF